MLKLQSCFLEIVTRLTTLLMLLIALLAIYGSFIYLTISWGCCVEDRVLRNLHCLIVRWPYIIFDFTINSLSFLFSKVISIKWLSIIAFNFYLHTYAKTVPPLNWHIFRTLLVIFIYIVRLGSIGFDLVRKSNSIELSHKFFGSIVFDFRTNRTQSFD